MRTIIRVFLCVVGLSCMTYAVDFNINLSSDINTDFYDFNGYNEEYSEDGINFEMTATQEGGRLFASGGVNAYEDGVHLDGTYTVKGTLSTYQDRLRLRRTISIKGLWYVYDYGELYSGKFSASVATDLTLNEAYGAMVGIEKVRMSVAGYSDSYSEVVTEEPPPGYGIGQTKLDISLDGDTRLAGNGILTLPSGETVDFISTATFDSRKMAYRINLRGDRYNAFSRGSTLSVTYVSNNLATVSGTVLGQRTKYNAAVKNYDGAYSGSYTDNYETGTWVITVDNGDLTGIIHGASDSYSVTGRVHSNGSFTFCTEVGSRGTGRVDLKRGTVSGRYTNPYEGVSGKLAGTPDLL